MSSLDSRIQDLAAALGQDVAIVQAAIMALAGGPIPVDLDPDTIALLRTVVAQVQGTVSVDNFPSTFSLPQEQLDALDPTDVEALLTAIRDRTPVLSEGRVPVALEDGNINVSASFDSKISVDNSTNIPLAANDTFTGIWEDVKNYAAIAAAFKTDADSAPNGALLQFSEDGINVLTAEAGTVPANIGGFSVLAPQARYVRVVYTNGPVAQTYLRAEVRFLFNAPTVTQSALGGPTSDLSVVPLSKSHLHGRVMDGPFAGLWKAIGTDGDGKVLVETGLTTQNDALTNDELRAQDINTADSGEREYIHAVATVTALGDTTVITPTPGKAIRLRWIYAINDPTAASAPLIRVSLGTTEIYRAWALSKRQLKTGEVDAPLIVNLTGSTGQVAVTAIYEEV